MAFGIAAPNTRFPTQTGGMFSGYGSSGNQSQTNKLWAPGQTNRFGGTVGGGNPSLSFKQAYPAAVEQTGEDYSNIMGGYKNILEEGSSPLMQNYQSLLGRNREAYSPITAKTINPSLMSESGLGQEVLGNYRNLYNTPVDPTLQEYNRDPDVAASIANLRGLAETGGYSDQDKSDLRARGISPIRSVYANAARNMDRQRTIQGGYSPNYNAASAKMTRELSDLVSGATQNVNAGIAQNVASNRLSAAPQFAQAAGRESDVQKGIEASNVGAKNRAAELTRQGRMDVLGNMTNIAGADTGAQNRAGELNTAAENAIAELNSRGKTDSSRYNTGMDFDILNSMKSLSSDDIAKKMSALNSMTSLYGTTPALASTFGNQAAQAAQIQEGANARTNRTGLDLITQSAAQKQQQQPIARRAPMQFPKTQASTYGMLPPWAYNNNILPPTGRSL